MKLSNPESYDVRIDGYSLCFQNFLQTLSMIFVMILNSTLGLGVTWYNFGNWIMLSNINMVTHWIQYGQCIQTSNIHRICICRVNLSLRSRFWHFIELQSFMLLITMSNFYLSNWYSITKHRFKRESWVWYERSISFIELNLPHNHCVELPC